MQHLLTGMLLVTFCSFGTATDPQKLPARDDLICYYACEPLTPANPIDAINSGVKAIYSGTGRAHIRSPFGTALRCLGEGDEDVFRYSLNLDKKDFTIAFWVKARAYSRQDFGNSSWGRGLVVYGYHPRLSIFLNDAGKMTLSMPDAGNAAMTAATVPPRHKWTHLAFVVDRDHDNGCRIYMNGESQPLTSVNMKPSAAYAYRMKSGFMFGRSLIGDMDELAVYGKALTQTEVQSLGRDIPESETAPPSNDSTDRLTITQSPIRLPFRLQAERRAAARKSRRIVFNDDGVYVKPFDTPDKFIGVRLQQTVNSQVDTVMFNVGATTIFTFDNEVGETYGEFVTNKSPEFAFNVKRGIEGLRKTGDSTANLALEYCHAHDMEFFLSLRMNDIHDSFNPFMFSQWKWEHPECLFGPKSLNYEFPEVREYIYRILESFCRRFDLDGIELDWWRGPRAFPPSWVGKPVTAAHLTMMNDLMRHIRIMTERVGEQRGRPLLVAVRTPMSVETSLKLGFDLKTWLKEDLIDVLTVGGGYVPMAIVSSVREMADTSHRYGVPVYSTISGSAMHSDKWYGTGHNYHTLEAWRGMAMNIWHAGADGVYTFNFFPRQEASDKPLYQLFGQMGSPETLRGLDKIYSIDRMIVEQFPPKGRWALVAPDRLPIPLAKTGWTAAKLPVGENISANTPVGKTCRVRLRLKITALEAGNLVAVRLNGTELGPAAPSPSLTPESSATWLTLDPDPDLFQAGYNLVEVKRTSARQPATPSVIDRLDLTVRYR